MYQGSMAELSDQIAGEGIKSKMSADDFALYNIMAETMEYFHSRFRTTGKMLYTACFDSERPANMLRGEIYFSSKMTQKLSSHLRLTKLQVLALKMPAFQKELELLDQHRHIHLGLAKLEAYLGSWRSARRI